MRCQAGDGQCAGPSEEPRPRRGPRSRQSSWEAEWVSVTSQIAFSFLKVTRNPRKACTGAALGQSSYRRLTAHPRARRRAQPVARGPNSERPAEIRRQSWINISVAEPIRQLRSQGDHLTRNPRKEGASGPAESLGGVLLQVLMKCCIPRIPGGPRGRNRDPGSPRNKGACTHSGLFASVPCVLHEGKTGSRARGRKLTWWCGPGGGGGCCSGARILFPNGIKTLDRWGRGSK